jgi:hypothetical protein
MRTVNLNFSAQLAETLDAAASAVPEDAEKRLRSEIRAAGNRRFYG